MPSGYQRVTLLVYIPVAMCTKECTQGALQLVPGRHRGSLNEALPFPQRNCSLRLPLWKKAGLHGEIRCVFQVPACKHISRNAWKVEAPVAVNPYLQNATIATASPLPGLPSAGIIGTCAVFSLLSWAYFFWWCGMSLIAIRCIPHHQRK